MRAYSFFGPVAAITLLTALPASAQDADVSIGASASSSGASSNASASASGAGDSGESYWTGNRPTSMALELGVYGGLAHFSKDHNLQNLQTIPDAQGHQELKDSPDLGVRLGFYPLDFLGVEGEVGGIWSRTNLTNHRATTLTYRAHGVLQYPGARIVPFVLFGGGGMNMTSSDYALGKDSDPEMHFGLGLKYAFSQYLSARFDFRDNLMQKNRADSSVKDGDLVQNLELLLGLSVTFGRTPSETPPVDTDKDGFVDPKDKCPTQPGVAPDGCPPPPPPPPPADTDKDGIPDTDDPCPTEAEDHADPKPDDGCPNKDIDGDGIPLPDDKCPDVKGVAPDGCIHDKDQDGINDEVDKCPDQPETKNGFQDADGCPDEIPKEVAKFSGVIKGINFDFGKATIKKDSNKLLDEAVKVLQQYPDLRISISGHTDNKGKDEVNQKLSEDRAAAVKEYMVSKGVDEKRIETRGAGPSEPIADNKTEKGRSQNRRIEFKLLQ